MMPLSADAGVTAAWIGLAGGVVVALVSAIVALREARAAERRILLDYELRAAETLARFREPLAAAAYDLQSRLYNILRLEFFAVWGHGDRADEAVRTTLFRIAQYFGWSEILRREIQFLAFREDEETRRVAELQSSIAQAFLSDSHGTAMMIWKDEQRAIGERMIVERDGGARCMGYADFREACDDVFGAWSPRIREELRDESAQTRLRRLQHLLSELVETLDDRRVRYTSGLERA